MDLILQRKMEIIQTFHLVTAHIVYRMPDHPLLLQTFTWQEHDEVPKYPRLNKFLDFWKAELDGKLHSVQVVAAQLIHESELRIANAEFRIH